MRLVHVALAAAIAAIGLVGCSIDIDQPWELDHDRIIAVRAEPPRILPGETSQIDMLLGFETLPVEARSPDFVTVVSPTSLASTVAVGPGGIWTVTAPTEAALASARTELGLEADAPVPLQLGVAAAWPTPVMSPEGNGFAATKTVWLGQEGQNPPMNGLTLDGGEFPPEGTELVFPSGTDIENLPKTRLAVEADEESDIVNWLTSCGEMHDFDLPKAYVTVGPEDRREGQLALVLRDELGGVTWRVWPCRAE